MNKTSCAEQNAAEPPLITVIMPIYNRQTTLSRAIESVRNQLFCDWELLCIDDGSDDGSVELVKSYCDNDARIQLHQIEHQGVSVARNVGQQHARGQIVSYLDSDNSWRSNYLYDVWSAIGSKVNVSCYAAMRVNILDDSGSTISQSTMLQTYERRRILRRNQIDMNTFAHSRDLVAACGGFDETMTRLCDWDLILRYTARRSPIKISSIGADYYHHRSSNRISMSASFAPNRVLISLKSHSPLTLRAVFVGVEPSNTVLEKFLTLGFPVLVIEKSGFESFNLQASDIVFWQSCPWDNNNAQMHQAIGKLEYGCALSFYLLSHADPHTYVSLPSYNRLHFIVCDSTEHKKGFQSYIEELQRANNQADVNPLDRILLNHGRGNADLGLDHFIETICDYSQANDAWGIQLILDSELEDSFSETLTDVSQILHGDGHPNDDVEINSEDLLHSVETGPLVYFASHHVPLLPAKQDKPRLLLLIGDDFALDPVRISQFDALLCNNRETAKAYRESYPLMRVYYRDCSEARHWARFLSTCFGLLNKTRMMGLAEHQIPRITFLTGNPSANSTRKRSLEMADTLSAIFPTQLVDQRCFELRHIVGSDLIIVQRWVERYGEPLDDFFYAASMLKLAGKTFVYDIDDHVLDYSQGLPKTFLSICDRVSCSTPFLEQQLSKYHPDTYCAPNMIDAEKISMRSIHLRPISNIVLSVSTDGLGYDRVCEVAEKIHRDHSQNVEFVFVSSVPLAANSHVEVREALEWPALFELMNRCDVMLNIAEMSQQLDIRLSENGSVSYDKNAFIQSKSAIKYHDSALSGIPLLTTNSPTQFSDWIRNGETGVVVNHVDDIYCALVNLIENPELRRRIAENARADVLRHHTLAAHWEGLAQLMLANKFEASKLDHRWHTEFKLSADHGSENNTATRYAKMLQLGSEGAQRAADAQDKKRLQQIRSLKRELIKAEQETVDAKHAAAKSEHQIRVVRADLEQTQERLNHYKGSFISRIINSIKFRLNRR
ncbi:MAG: glycosyltransferase [Pseudomonadales bacterium]